MPVDIAQIKNHINNHIQRQAANLSPNGDIPPCAFLYVQGRSQPVMMQLDIGADPAQKQAASFVLSAVAMEMKAEALVLLTTAWLSRRESGRPSQDPQRRECVWATIERRDTSGELVLFDIQRNPDSAPTFVFLESSEHSGERTVRSGTFSGMLSRSPEEIPEPFRGVAEEIAVQLRAHLAAHSVH